LHGLKPEAFATATRILTSNPRPTRLSSCQRKGHLGHDPSPPKATAPSPSPQRVGIPPRPWPRPSQDIQIQANLGTTTHQAHMPREHRGPQREHSARFRSRIPTSTRPRALTLRDHLTNKNFQPGVTGRGADALCHWPPLLPFTHIPPSFQHQPIGNPPALPSAPANERASTPS